MQIYLFLSLIDLLKVQLYSSSLDVIFILFLRNIFVLLLETIPPDAAAEAQCCSAVLQREAFTAVPEISVPTPLSGDLQIDQEAWPKPKEEVNRLLD